MQPEIGPFAFEAPTSVDFEHPEINFELPAIPKSPKTPKSYKSLLSYIYLTATGASLFPGFGEVYPENQIEPDREPIVPFPLHEKNYVGEESRFKGGSTLNPTLADYLAGQIIVSAVHDDFKAQYYSKLSEEYPYKKPLPDLSLDDFKNIAGLELNKSWKSPDLKPVHEYIEDSYVQGYFDSPYSIEEKAADGKLLPEELSALFKQLFPAAENFLNRDERQVTSIADANAEARIINESLGIDPDSALTIVEMPGSGRVPLKTFLAHMSNGTMTFSESGFWRNHDERQHKERVMQLHPALAQVLKQAAGVALGEMEESEDNRRQAIYIADRIEDVIDSYITLDAEVIVKVLMINNQAGEQLPESEIERQAQELLQIQRDHNHNFVRVKLLNAETPALPAFSFAAA